MESGKAVKNLEKGQNQEPAPVPVPVPVAEPSTSKGTGSKPSRPRRGRPTGANRTPLSLEERRARNAQYERERREDLAQAQAELAEAAGCDPNVSEADLLAFVVNKLSADKLEVKQSIEEYRRLNAKLEAHSKYKTETFFKISIYGFCSIASCLQRLGPDYVDSDDDEEVQLEEPNHNWRRQTTINWHRQ
uniref:SFRICE_033354 n=1 Tax=Spodoptera frugiperda TaxID=7108 RepID=A0A2H1WC47_SPOFR